MDTAKKLLWQNHSSLIKSMKDLEEFKAVLNNDSLNYEVQVGVLTTASNFKSKSVVGAVLNKIKKDDIDRSIVETWNSVGVSHTSEKHGVLCLRYKRAGESNWNMLLENEWLLFNEGALLHRIV